MEEINLEKYKEKIFGKNAYIKRLEQKDSNGIWHELDIVTLKKKKEKPKIKYKVFNIRLHDETKKKFIDRWKGSGLSWNLFVLDLLNKK